MANADERDTEYGYGRTQPEFSLGERMATMEAEARKGQEFEKERIEWQEKLAKEQLASIRQEMTTKDTSQKEAIGKAEKAAAETATALATELRQTTGQTQTRLGALEVGGAGTGGQKLGAGELLTSERANRAEERAQKAINVAIMTAAIAALALLKAAGII
jgi:hypothetical protein